MTAAGYLAGIQLATRIGCGHLPPCRDRNCLGYDEAAFTAGAQLAARLAEAEQGYLAGIRLTLYRDEAAAAAAAAQLAARLAEAELCAQAAMSELAALILFGSEPTDPALAGWCPWGDPAEPYRLRALADMAEADYRYWAEELDQLAAEFAEAAS